MKEVKIYTIVSDQLSPPITGESYCTDMVRHSDYAELEAKYAALAADNDKAMESLRQANAVVKLAHEKFSAMAAENTALKKSEVEFNEYCRHECEDVGDTWVDDFTETPATDAFLAEIRAQGVEYYAAQLKSEAELADETGWDGAAKFLISESEKVLAFAAQLRQEAAQ
ncbi:Eae-like protein [Salmonella enterica]|uniref:Eae-like protein n=1 Tax=Salmonella enterica TaxID=28901 RepID=A0A402XBK2_SALER|nr:Eae-like protein [Salmonella enterica]EBQ2950038.1 Eae-like protein [Salmonella enterica]MIV62611.1 Eae-like protein [Salmonella enterica]